MQATFSSIRCLFRRKFHLVSAEMQDVESPPAADPPPAEQPPVHLPVPPPVQTGTPGWAKVRRKWASAGDSARSEASDGGKRVSSPIGRRSSTSKGSPSGRNSRSGSMRPLTQLEVDDEVKALREQLKAVSLTNLEKGFHSGTHKQVDSLQLSRLFGKLGLTASPEAIKEIGRVTDNADGTLSKQELLEWLEGGGGAGGGAGGSAEGGAQPGGDGELPSRALELLGLLPGGAASSAASRQRSFQALALFDSDGDGQARLRYCPLARAPLGGPCLSQPSARGRCTCTCTWVACTRVLCTRYSVGGRGRPSCHVAHPPR